MVRRMANLVPLAIPELLRAVERLPVPTPERGHVAHVDLSDLVPGATSVSFEVDIRKIGETEWRYEGPLSVTGHGAADLDALREDLRKALGAHCVEVRVRSRAGDVADATAFFRARDTPRPH